MDAALKKSVITLNSQFRDYTDDPNSCDFTTTPGFVQGLHGNTSYTVQSGRPLFYGVEKIALLDATFTDSANNSPVFDTVTVSIVDDTTTTIPCTSTAGFPSSGVIYIVGTTEQIAYGSTNATQFLNCIRGFNSTTPAAIGTSAIYMVGNAEAVSQTAITTTITCTSTAGFSSSGVIYIVGTTEQIAYDSTNATQFLNCIRGFNGTTPAAIGTSAIYMVGNAEAVSQTAITTTITCTSTAGFSSSGVIYIADTSEQIAYGSTNATQFLNCIRGFNGTTAAVITGPSVISPVEDTVAVSIPDLIATTITGTDTTGFTSPGVIYIAETGEQIAYGSTNATQYLNCSRGFNGTSPAIAGTSAIYLAGLAEAVTYNATTTTITGMDTAGFPSSGVIYIVETSEQISYGSTNATQFLNCIRGFNGTTAAAITGTSDIYLVGDAEAVTYNAITTTITGMDTAGFPSTGVIYIVETSEQISYGSTNATQFLNCIRGFNGTTAAVITGTSDIYLVGDAVSVPYTPSTATTTIIPGTDTTGFPSSGIIYIAETGEQIAYGSINATQYLNCIRGFNDTTATAIGTSIIYLVGEPYFYIRLTEPSIGPFEAVEMSSENNHYNRFFAKVPINTSKLDTYQYFNHDGKWSSWTNWVNFSQPFPYIEKLRMQTFRFYGNTRYEWPNPNSDYTKSLPLNFTFKVDAHENKMWDNRGVIVDASENDSESSGEEF